MATSKRESSIDESVVSEIRKQSRLLVRELDVLKGLFLTTEFTFSQIHVLFELGQHGSLRLMEIAEKLLLDKSNASRSMKHLIKLGAISVQQDPSDNRQRNFSLTRKGKSALQTIVAMANEQVESALENLDHEQQLRAIEGMKLYANALRKSRLQEGFEIRPIKRKDNPQVARVIREVMTEFGAVGEGYSIEDPEVDEMFSNYNGKRHCYHVIVKDGIVVGGGGIAPLNGGTKSTCELRKMFFTPTTRGVGLGRKLLMRLLKEAKEMGFKQCYLETLDRMWQAKALYEKHGFKLLDGPMGNTGHSSCELWYLAEL